MASKNDDASHASTTEMKKHDSSSEEEKKEEPKIPFSRLFRYADGTDKVCGAHCSVCETLNTCRFSWRSLPFPQWEMVCFFRSLQSSSARCWMSFKMEGQTGWRARLPISGTQLTIQVTFQIESQCHQLFVSGSGSSYIRGVIHGGA